jgi:hypothetical protein
MVGVCTYEGEATPGLPEGAAVAEEADEEDEGAGGDQDVTQLRDDVGLGEVLELQHNKG